LALFPSGGLLEPLIVHGLAFLLSSYRVLNIILHPFVTKNICEGRAAVRVVHQKNFNKVSEVRIQFVSFRVILICPEIVASVVD